MKAIVNHKETEIKFLCRGAPLDAKSIANTKEVERKILEIQSKKPLNSAQQRDLDNCRILRKNGWRVACGKDLTSQVEQVPIDGETYVLECPCELKVPFKVRRAP